MSEVLDHRPQGLRDVTPYLIVEGVEQLIEFLQAAFGATVEARYDDEHGGVRHAQVRVGDSVLEMGTAGGEWKATPCSLHYYVPDADAVYAAALAAGATSLYPLTERDYGDREAGVRDPSGNQWFIATHVRDAEPHAG